MNDHIDRRLGDDTARLATPSTRSSWSSPRKRASTSRMSRAPRRRRATARCPCSPSSAARTSASRRWSTASSAAARPSSRTSPASPATASPTRPNWAGRRFKIVDTGGWEQDVLGIDASVAAQAEFAIEAADAVVFVVDATVGATDTDEAVVRLLRRAGKPVVLAANKVDGPSGEADAAALWTLGPRRAATRSPRCTAAAPATCSTPSWRRCPRRPRMTFGDRGRRPAPDRADRPARTSASPPC